MTANPPPVTPTPHPEYTGADGEAMFASVVWFRGERSAGRLAKYEGLHVAVLGEAIIDADRDSKELVRRLEAMGDDSPLNRVVTQYLPTLEESIRGYR